jgi:hypothetical protein
MKLRCPACGAEITLDQAGQAAELQALDKAAAAFGDDWPLVQEYLDCFSKEHRQDACATKMKVAKRLRLARELWEMWQAGRFAIGGIWYRIGREEFREALRTTCNQVLRGLTNHNYLKKVLVAAAEKTSQREERELREKEAGLRSAGRDARPTAPEDEDPAYRAEILRLGRGIRQARTPEAKEVARAAMAAFMAEGRNQK